MKDIENIHNFTLCLIYYRARSLVREDFALFVIKLKMKSISCFIVQRILCLEMIYLNTDASFNVFFHLMNQVTAEETNICEFITMSLFGNAYFILSHHIRSTSLIAFMYIVVCYNPVLEDTDYYGGYLNKTCVFFTYNVHRQNN